MAPEAITVWFFVHLASSLPLVIDCQALMCFTFAKLSPPLTFIYQLPVSFVSSSVKFGSVLSGAVVYCSVTCAEKCQVCS